MRSLAFALTLVVPIIGCAREPLPEICPIVEPGELVISELRGDQAETSDSYGQWLELYNASGRNLDLQGIRVTLVFDSGDEASFLVREEVEVAADGYAALGPGRTDSPATWLDYAIGWDLPGGNENDPPTNLLSEASGRIRVSSCDDELIDEVAFAALPIIGTRACGNASAPPDALANDDTTIGCWCDDAADPEGPVLGIGQPGTPGEANRCP